MGTDKALLDLGDGPLARVVADALVAAGADRVVLVGASELAARATGLELLADRWPGEGPLGGLATVLAAADPRGVVLVAACDQPDLDPDLLRSLVVALRGADDAVVAAVPIDPGGRRHPLPAAWRASTADPVAELLGAGERRLAAAATTGLVVEVATTPAAATSLADLDDAADVAARAARRAPAPAAPSVAPSPPRRLPRQPDHPEEAVDVPEIDIDEAAARIAAGATVVDVREPDEYADGHVPGAALIPLGDVAERSDEVPTDREVLIICKMGGRSLRAAEHLRTVGVDAVNIAGGTMAWIEAGHPVATGDEPGA
jgi:rhodanese-related sulfurtransferase/molybdopterin-guanine dinucleotide biosynthesis protein A